MGSLVSPVAPVPLAELGRVHFTGIGGAGMSGIARIMIARGVKVSGSDSAGGDLLASLAALGADVHVGHAAANLAGADTVVVSSAIRPGNPELLAARAQGLRVLHRAAALASVMLGRRGVAVAGTHGKTTTTSMITTALRHCGADPGYVLGGILTETGLGADDLDNYSSLAEIEDAFAAFARRITPGGVLVACADDPGARALASAAAALPIRVRTYGEAAGADYRITSVAARGMSVSLEIEGAPRLQVGVPGRHNALNAAAAYAAVLELGLPPVRAGQAASGLAAYRGARRRMEPKGEARGVTVLDSYAHHPTELAADLRAARDIAPGGRVIAVFQPHLFSRTRIFAAQFGAALGLADEVFVLDVYPAREDPEPGVTGELVASAVPGGRAVFLPDRAAAPGAVADIARPGDLVLTMGAGDVTALGPLIVAALGARAGAPG